jgi:hypothetical protein
MGRSASPRVRQNDAAFRNSLADSRCVEHESGVIHGSRIHNWHTGKITAAKDRQVARPVSLYSFVPR